MCGNWAYAMRPYAPRSLIRLSATHVRWLNRLPAAKDEYRNGNHRPRGQTDKQGEHQCHDEQNPQRRGQFSVLASLPAGLDGEDGSLLLSFLDTPLFHHEFPAEPKLLNRKRTMSGKAISATTITTPSPLSTLVSQT